MKREAIAAGVDVIDFGVGDPDTPTPDFIVDALVKAARDPACHRYPTGAGTATFREACKAFLKRRFDVTLNDDRQLTALIGTKEGIGHLPMAVVNPGEHVLIPDPGYPVYTAGTIFAGGVPHAMPLSVESHWLPDFEAVPGDVARNAKLMFLNYPNNPTGAVTDRRFFERALRFARRYDILIAHDAAYSELYFDSKPPSILELDGAFDYACEFHSLSKTFNMTGWRIGFAVGNADAVGALAKVKDNVDSGPFNAIQSAAAEALNHMDHVSVRAMTDIYRERRDIVVDALRTMGISVDTPQAGFYVWAKCPDGYTSMEFAAKALKGAGVVVIPGIGFGRSGEGYFRIALTVDADRTRRGLERLNEITW